MFVNSNILNICDNFSYFCMFTPFIFFVLFIFFINIGKFEEYIPKKMSLKIALVEKFQVRQKIISTYARQNKKRSKNYSVLYAAGRGRTVTVSLPPDFESGASANSTTAAYIWPQILQPLLSINYSATKGNNAIILALFIAVVSCL